MSWAAAGSALAGLLGGLFSSGGSLASGFMSYSSAKKLQEQQNAFTERMSNTAYSRSTTDMRNAGLNPAMMYGSGSAASTPTAGGSNGVPFENPASSALNFFQTAATIRNTAKQGSLLDEQAKTEANKRENLDSISDLNRAENIRRDKSLPYDLRLKAAQTKSALANALLDETKASYEGVYANSASRQADASIASSNAAKVSAEKYSPSQVLGSELRHYTSRTRKYLDKGLDFLESLPYRHGRSGSW
nr:MAG TPA: minor capsid protein [Microviridae sp.]